MTGPSDTMERGRVERGRAWARARARGAAGYASRLRECAQSPYRWANVCVGGGWVCTFMFTVIVKDAPHEGITEEGGWQP